MRAIGEADLRSRVARLCIEQKVRLLTGADFWALYPEPGGGLRRIVTSDGPAGVRGETWDERDTSANIPSPTALAATWDCDPAPGRGARSSRSTPRARTRRSSVRPGGWPASPPSTRTPARR